MTAVDLSQLSMHELFRTEAENQTQVLTASLLALERNPTAADHLEACMRAAHSLKGGRIVDIGAADRGDAMGGIFVAETRPNHTNQGRSMAVCSGVIDDGVARRRLVPGRSIVARLGANSGTMVAMWADPDAAPVYQPPHAAGNIDHPDRRG